MSGTPSPEQAKARNRALRPLLAQRWPAARFHVRNGLDRRLYVSWVDGPTQWAMSQFLRDDPAVAAIPTIDGHVEIERKITMRMRAVGHLRLHARGHLAIFPDRHGVGRYNHSGHLAVAEHTITAEEYRRAQVVCLLAGVDPEDCDGVEQIALARTVEVHTDVIDASLLAQQGTE